MPSTTCEARVPPYPPSSGEALPLTSPSPVDTILDRFPVRPYQRDAVRSMAARHEQRTRIHIAALPTGSGKTRIGITLAVYLLRQGYSILWITQSWHLLKQAADQFAAIGPEYAGELRRIGGEGTCLRELPDDGQGRAYFTTLHTWSARRGELPSPSHPSPSLAVIWDEVHWGIHISLGRRFRQDYLGIAVIYGLSATPQSGVMFRSLIASQPPHSKGRCWLGRSSARSPPRPRGVPRSSSRTMRQRPCAISLSMRRAINSSSRNCSVADAMGCTIAV